MRRGYWPMSSGERLHYKKWRKRDKKKGKYEIKRGKVKKCKRVTIEKTGARGANIGGGPRGKILFGTGEKYVF